MNLQTNTRVSVLRGEQWVATEDRLSGALDARLTTELLRGPDPFRWVLPLLHACMPEDTRDVR
jgi:hypothetical protein